MNLVLSQLCSILANQSAAVDWSAFSLADWGQLAPLAQGHGVVPLVCERLNAVGWPSRMPVAVRQALQHANYAAAAQHVLIHGELQRIVAALAPALPVVLLKGAALGTTIYPSPALRPLGDLDLLVRRDDMHRAVAVLRGLGYAPVEKLLAGIHHPLDYHLALRGGPDERVYAELHWGLVANTADWRSPPADWFWQQTEAWLPGSVDNPNPLLAEQGARQLTPTAHLLYLAAHLMLQHGDAQPRLVWLYDLHLLVTICGPRLAWNEVVEYSAAFRWAAALHNALLGAQTCFGTPLPPGFLDALLARADAQSLLLVQRKASGSYRRALGLWLDLSALNQRARWRMVWMIVWPSPSYMRWRYPMRLHWLWPLSYPLRWLLIMSDVVYSLYSMTRRRHKQVDV